MKIKPWQIIVIVVGLVAAIGVTVWNLTNSDELDIPNSYFVIDVESGQIYRVNRNRVMLSLPAPNPESGKLSLIGLAKDDKGYYVTERDLATLRMLDSGVKNNAVDEKTGELKNQSQSFIDYKKP